MRKTTFFLPILLISFLFNACQKENNNGDGLVKYTLKTVNRSSTITARTAGTITWTSGFANAVKIEFEAESDDKEVEFKSTSGQRIDLFAPLVTVGQIQIPPGNYEEVEFKIVLAPANGEPALELRGTYNGTPVVFRITDEFEFESEKDNVTIDVNNGYTVLTTVDLSRLTSGVTDAALASAVLTNGELLISSSVNTSLYNTIIDNLGESEDCDFHDDDDDNDDDD